jgi:hypothetical protein
VDVGDLSAPSVIASLDVVRGEQLFATRFTPDAAYVVTFEQVDPLWVIDLQDPASPEVVGSLVVPGWSTHLVPAGPGRLVAVGVDPTDGWRATASLFDVSDPSAPVLADRADLGVGWSTAFHDRKALGVFPGDGLVFVPFSGESDRVAVLDLGASSLDLRGWIDLVGVPLRGFPHPRGLVGVSSEEVVVVDPGSLAPTGRCTVAENVVDACRLPDGTLLPLVARGAQGRLGDVDLPLAPWRLHRHGFQVAVTGWDDLGRAAYVVDFDGPSPVLSERFDLGGGWFEVMPLGTASFAPDGVRWGGFGADEAVLTPGGRLVARGVAGGGPSDGFVVIDVAAGALDPPVAVGEGWVTGFVADGEALVYTVGSDGGLDREGRPRVRHDLVRVDLVTRAASTPANVPGWVVSVGAGLTFTAEEAWGAGWDWRFSVVALALDPVAGPAVVDRLALPEGAYDLRAAGATLWFATMSSPFDGGGGGEPPGPLLGAPGGAFWLPTTTVATVRLGPDLALGPSIEEEGRFRTLLLPEDGSGLLVRDGVVLERWDVSGGAAVPLWSEEVGGYPLHARADAAPGTYLVALGYGGLAEAP